MQSFMATDGSLDDRHLRGVTNEYMIARTSRGKATFIEKWTLATAGCTENSKYLVESEQCSLCEWDHPKVLGEGLKIGWGCFLLQWLIGTTDLEMMEDLMFYKPVQWESSSSSSADKLGTSLHTVSMKSLLIAAWAQSLISNTIYCKMLCTVFTRAGFFRDAIIVGIKLSVCLQLFGTLSRVIHHSRK